MTRFSMVAAMTLVCWAGNLGAAFDELEPVTEPVPPGALTGASVFVSAGHGWFISSQGRWATQRGVSHGVIEDHSNAEAVNQFFLPYLWNAGARVYSARERDMNTNMVILNAGSSRDVVLRGDWSTWRGSGTWHSDMVWTTTTNGEPTASATFIPRIPEDGYYAVYAWYRSAPPTARADGRALPTAADARFIINHSGGTTVWTQDLAKDSQTWTYLGHYWFEQGRSQAIGSVVVDNASTGPASAVVVDAIRFGGGMGDTLVGGRTSGKPRWEESGLYYAPFAGFSAENDTRSFGTVTAMPLWAEWECEDWELGRSIYFSWHTNASNGRTRGLSSFTYGPNSWKPQDNFTGFPLGVELQNATHAAVLDEVRRLIEPGWRDIGRITRWLGEVNPRNNNRMPAALLEYGFHDNAEDAALILDPRFRDVISRASMEGIVRFYADHMEGFTIRTLPPHPPEYFTVQAEGEGVRLAWRPSTEGDPATRFRVMTSRNGKGFDNGGLTEKTSVLLPAPPEGEIRHYRVAARNEGGESFPTETLAVRLGRSGEPRVLVVNGFDRLDRRMNWVQEDGSERGILSRMNSRDYVIQHGRALQAAALGFDSVSNETVTSAMLGKYPAVVWILGQENTIAGALPPATQSMLDEYLRAGGSLMLSGSEWASALASEAAARAFLTETLGIASAGVHQGAQDLRPALGSEALTQLPPMRFETGPTGRVYPVRTASSLEPTDDSVAVLQLGESGPSVAVASTTRGRVFSIGVPLETILDVEYQGTLMAAAMRFLLTGQLGEKETAWH